MVCLWGNLGKQNPISTGMNWLKLSTQTLERGTRIASVALLMTIFIVITGNAQSDYVKQNRRHQRAYYKTNTGRLLNACNILNRKRVQDPHRSLLASNKNPRIGDEPERPKGRQLSSDHPEVAEHKPRERKPVDTPPQQPKTEQVSDKKLEDLHKKEDNVLAKNELPVPTSSKHEEIRKQVSEEIKKKPVTEPLKLAPLYFQFNQDEFSVVDMEPFLVAVEYALQGHTVLIEGHTDNRGQDDYNVKLSVKRVQRIRQLMLDMGVPDERISIIGYGEEQGKKSEGTEAAHQNNRRVDFTVF
jgi:outer membrane protein OmpA-like peptidoglycan-associated protein